MKLRVSRQLHERAKMCADAVGDRLCEWCRLAMRQARNGAFIGVAVDDSLVDATRGNSTVITVDGEMEPDSYRRVIAMAVAFCEARNPKPFTPALVEGRDFIIAQQEV